MEQDIEGIATRVLARLLEPIRQEMRNGFRDVNANITGIRADITEVRVDIRRLHLSSIRVWLPSSLSALLSIYDAFLRLSTRGDTTGLQDLTRS
jgi:hypothetical protein